MGSHLRSDSTWLHRLSSPQVKRARTVSRLRIFYIIMIRAFRLECSFCIRSQSRHLTAYDALLLRLTTKGRSRSQKRRPKHVPRTFYFLQPMLVLIRFFNKYNHHQSKQFDYYSVLYRFTYIVRYGSQNANSNANLTILYLYPMFILSRFFSTP